MTSRETDERRQGQSGPERRGGPDGANPVNTAASAPNRHDGEHAKRDEHHQREHDRSRRRHKPHKTSLPLWQEVIILLGLALILAVVVKAFFVQAFFVPSGSMEPQFVKGDRILVEKVSYWGDDIERGDVIVFDDPGGWLNAAESRPASGLFQRGLEAVGLYPTGGHLVKRVVGIGGDRVACCDKQGRVTVNGVVLKEQYLAPGVEPSEQTFDVKVPDDALWVMGDNRLASGDSRVHVGDPGGGAVPVEDVVGKVWGIVWPLGRTEVLDRPDIYSDPALDGS